jgi:hypothetical protein
LLRRSRFSSITMTRSKKIVHRRAQRDQGLQALGVAALETPPPAPARAVRQHLMQLPFGVLGQRGGIDGGIGRERGLLQDVRDALVDGRENAASGSSRNSFSA